MTTAEAALDAYEENLANGRRAEAYEAALVAWRATRAPEIASFIEKLSATFCGRAPLDVRKRGALQRAWIPVARSRKPWDLRWLVEQLAEAARWHGDDPRAIATIAACMAELGEPPDDPSITEPAIAIARVRVRSASWDGALNRWISWMSATGDERLVGALDALALKLLREPGFAGVKAQKVAANLQEQTRATCEPALASRARMLEAALDGPLPPAAKEAEPTPATLTTRELFDRVLVDPDDDAARAVWADALLQSGDPNGELIALLVAAETNPKLRGKANQALKKGWRSLVRPIAGSIRSEGLAFRGGLLSQCVAVAKTQSAADLLFQHEEFQTVRVLQLEKFGRLTGVMQWLEEVANATESGLTDLTTITLPRLRTLDVRVRTVAGDKKRSRGLSALAGATGLPALKELVMRHDNETSAYIASETPMRFDDWIFEAPFASQLELVSLPVHWYRWPTIDLAHLLERLSGLPRLSKASLCPGVIHAGVQGVDATYSIDLHLDVQSRTVSVRYGVRDPQYPGERDDACEAVGKPAAAAAEKAKLAWGGIERSVAGAPWRLGRLG